MSSEEVCGKNYALEVVRFRGHRNIKANHDTTIEITKENWLTPRGDCIIGVEADKGLMDFSDCFKALVRREGALIIAVIIAEGFWDIVIGEGSSKLTYSDKDRIIIRKSTHISGNTVMIRANKAARDLNRKMIEALRKGGKGYAFFISLIKPNKLQELSTRPKHPLKHLKFPLRLL